MALGKGISIRTRLIGMTLVFIFGTSIAMGMIGIRLTTQFLTVRFHESYSLLAAYTARNAALGALLGDARMLSSLVNNLMVQEDIEGVAIHSVSGDVLAIGGRVSPSAPGNRVESPIMGAFMDKENLVIDEATESEEVGKVVLVYSSRGLDHLKKTMAVRFILISVILAVVPVVAYWFIARSIVAPLYDLVAAAAEVSKGRMDMEVSGGSLSETRTLGAAFNDMLRGLKRQRKELEDAHAEMTRQQTLAEMGKMSMLMAHEVKNPLSIIRGSLSVLKKKDLDAPTREEMLLYLDEEAKRIDRLMEDFLLFARPRSPVFREMEMNGWARNLAARLDLMDRPDGIEYGVHIEDAQCTVVCDPQLMERAMLNIFRNALDACGKGGRVEVETAHDSEAWIFRVKDSGPGIASGQLSEIFTPFFSTKAKGTGLGLAIAKGAVDAHVGAIHAENRPSGGACFEIRLKIGARET